jgi:lysyl-tRNA synthetase class I
MFSNISTPEYAVSYFRTLSLSEQIFLRTIAQDLKIIDSWNSENIEKRIFQLSNEFRITLSKTFEYLYQLFLNKKFSNKNRTSFRIFKSIICD